MNQEQHRQSLLDELDRAYTMPESETLRLLETILGDYDHRVVSATAKKLIETIRSKPEKRQPFAAFLREYNLNSEEGIVLMSIAEGLFRIPDEYTRQRFLQEKLADADWQSHQSQSDSPLVNLATTLLVVSGRFEQHIRQSQQERKRILEGLLARMGQPLIGRAVRQAMRQMAENFVIAETIEAALANAHREPNYRYSFDMLGEAALTKEDAQRYFQDYRQAIETLANKAHGKDIFAHPGISVKLSALHPRFEPLQYRKAIPELSATLLNLAKLSRQANISLTLDAEEAERLRMTLDVFASVFNDPAMAGWCGFGLAVQAYQKRAVPVIRWLADLAESQRRIIPLRLVKGAYWDSEIKHAQENGWNDYPVFTRKTATDISFLACARLILSKPLAFYPQFATHNAHSVAAIRYFGQGHPGYEFQRLHGMGTALYDVLLQQPLPDFACRVYAPVGRYRDLLPYLVRRLLENGANSSFINQIENPAVGTSQLSRDPLEQLQRTNTRPIPLPEALFGTQRRNSRGLNLSDLGLLAELQRKLDTAVPEPGIAHPLIAGRTGQGDASPVYNPANAKLLGKVVHSRPEHIEEAVREAAAAFAEWRLYPAERRATLLQNTANLFEERRLDLATLAVLEGGRTLHDALAEVREAVDLCRYYAACAIELFARPQQLPGPTGETNRSFHYGRGVFACISPWNFPIAIFTGQIAAALAAGNTVVAKPALQTGLTAMACLHLLHEAGIPERVLHFLPGEGAAVGKLLLDDGRIAGVAFTGSCATAQIINRQLSMRSGAIAALIAETGGQNVLIADSTAHEEQLVADALQSAFNSAGQRCSCLRVLFLPEETAERIIRRIIGAMQLLRVGPPSDIGIDIGPVIDQRALASLDAHVQKLQRQARLLYRTPLPAISNNGHFFPPTLAEIPELAFLEEEVFGPVLHVVRYPGNALAEVVEAVNKTGFGLTLGLHTRIAATMQYVQQHARVGNVYINRNMIGAVVGVQPFGGMARSGTGPKAGGSEYLLRFSAEQTVTNNITAIGGNPWLLNT